MSSTVSGSHGAPPSTPPPNFILYLAGLRDGALATPSLACKFDPNDWRYSPTRVTATLQGNGVNVQAFGSYGDLQGFRVHNFIQPVDSWRRPGLDYRTVLLHSFG